MTLKNRAKNHNSMKDVSEFYREIMFIHVMQSYTYILLTCMYSLFFYSVAPVPIYSSVRRSNEANESGNKDYQDVYVLTAVCYQTYCM